MRSVRIVAAGLVLVAAAALCTPVMAARRPAPTPSPTAVPAADPAVTKVAMQQFLAWQIGTIDRSRYTDDLSALITPDSLSNTAKALTQLGALQRAEYLGPRNADGIPAGSKTYLYRMHCSVGSVYMQFSLTPQGKVAGIIYRDNITDF